VVGVCHEKFSSFPKRKLKRFHPGFRVEVGWRRKIMDLNVALRLGEKIDQLLERMKNVEEESRRLLAENKALMEERELFCAELDKILAKLDQLDEEIS
jgi:hypothetical protein